MSRTIYQKIYDDPNLGKEVLSRLLINPLGLLDHDLINKWIKINNSNIYFPPSIEPDLEEWITVLSPIEQCLFRYTIGRVQYRRKFKTKRWGPALPIAGGTVEIGLAAGAITAGALSGIGLGGTAGVMATSGVAEDINNNFAKGTVVVVGGTVATVGGAFLGGCGGAVAGGCVAIPLLIGAAKNYTYGVCKSLILWPTTPFDYNRTNNLEAIRQTLFEFSQLLEHGGKNFQQESYQEVIEDKRSLGLALSSLFHECSKYASTQSCRNLDKVTFLAAFKNLVDQKSFMPSGGTSETWLVYRKMKHIRDLVLIEVGIPRRHFHQIVSNGRDSHVQIWINNWEQENRIYQSKKDKSDKSTLTDVEILGRRAFSSLDY